MSIRAAQFRLDRSFEGTLQQQIQQIQQIVSQGILSGRFLPGDRMPSTRALAAELEVGRITVGLAYAELVATEYLTTRGRSGHFVADTVPLPPDFTIGRAGRPDGLDWNKTIVRKFSGQPHLARPTNWRDYPYPFIYGQPDPLLFDRENWRRCALDAHGRKDFEAVAIDAYAQDDPKLVEFIVRNVLPRRGISAQPDEVLITLGAQNAIWICAQLLLGLGKTAVIENPCYPGLRQVLHHSSCTTVSVNVDAHGLAPDSLTAQADVVFTTASHQCPTNATMPLERRMALIRKSAQDGFVIVEDDYESEIPFDRRPTPSLKSLDDVGTVVHMGSFSKSLFPGLRLGYLVAPAAFIHEARALRSMVLRHPPGSLQRTTAYFLSRGYHDAMLNRLGKAYGRRRATMERAIQDHGLAIAGPQRFGGSSFWLKAPDGVNTSEAALSLRRKGVLIEPGQAFFDPSDGRVGFYRLAYSSIPSARIAQGIAHIAETLAEAAP